MKAVIVLSGPSGRVARFRPGPNPPRKTGFLREPEQRPGGSRLLEHAGYVENLSDSLQISYSC